MNRIEKLVAGGVALVLLGTAATACGDDTAGSATSAKPSSGQEQLARDSAVPATNAYSADGSSSKGAVAAATAPAGGPAPSLSTALDRKIIFNATLSLGARDVTSTFNVASRIATNAGGFVEKSSFTGSDETTANLNRSASLTLRIPADRYQSTLADLRGMDGVSVKSEGSKSAEVTEQYTDLQSRLRNLERTETQYLATAINNAGNLLLCGNRYNIGCHFFYR